MSMLTPPGMGGKYRIKGDKFPRMRPSRRRGRFALLAVASVAVLALIGWGTLQLIDVFSGGGSATAASEAKGCTRPSPSPAREAALPKPGQVKVNVYNATPREGLAKDTADELKKRGFAIGKVGNAPEQFDKKVKGAGLLLGARASADSTFPVLGTQLAGAGTKTDARTGKDVDLIIGDGFKQLVTKKTATKAMASLSHPTPATSAPPKC
ncbi:LytR C-terminal domain-containing protein [Streptomyces tsukubensis]|uniref:LytR/CpsA/Psr regulator C-terminal domain-containing protein n=1 Tax=Streptomyces tsukubensis TaxID=83656 RepID=A0A1V4A9I4_9ACTN|nr:LytR C-terminal domain-containing protein [Streptomyces tsukubensis]OON79166.1 hypothetical protein B1H18_14400 [Streptomyces tsukubensis]QFR94722.1 LytR family transcriptional regulator [Streptomyces tsukubensis]